MMFALKVMTTISILFLFGVVLYTLQQDDNPDKNTMVGVAVVEFTFLAALLCMWLW